MSTYLGFPSNDRDANRDFGRQSDGSFHHGVDWGWGQGDTVYAMEAGTVTEVKTLADYGKIVTIDHGTSLIPGHHAKERACHLSVQSVVVGQKVTRGQKIGVMGDTGSLTTQKHLHSELWLDDTRVDEQPYQKKEIPIMPTRTVRADIRARVRIEPSTAHAYVDLLDVNSTPEVFGWIHGEKITDDVTHVTTDIWYQTGKPDTVHTKGLWACSTGFTTQSTAGLVDLNPPTPVAVGATKEEIQRMLNDFEGRISALIAAVPVKVIEEQKKPGN